MGSALIHAHWHKVVSIRHATKLRRRRCLVQEITPMLIYMLALAMTVLMLIATAFAMYDEAQRVRNDENRRRFDGFGASRRH